MAGTDPRVDAYIGQAADFARPILTHIRAAVHKACPDIEEGIKWSMPFFMLDGKNLANMAAFKQHAAFGFWKDIDLPRAGEAMGHFGRLASIDDLPDEAQFVALIRSVAERMKTGPVDSGRARKPPVKVPPLPDDLASAIAASAEAQKTFDGFSPSNRRDYIEWVSEAKRDATREKRIATAVEWMAEGKDRNWKYR